MIKITTKTETKIETTYTIALTKPQARVLQLIMWHVGGSPEDSLRGVSDPICEALDAALGSPTDEERALIHGSLSLDQSLDIRAEA